MKTVSVENTGGTVSPNRQKGLHFPFNSFVRRFAPPRTLRESCKERKPGMNHPGLAASLLALVLLSVSIPVQADGTLTDAARDAARHFLEQRTQELGDRVTVRVRAARANLPPCQRPQPFLPGNGQRLPGRVTVGVRCADGQVRYLRARVTARGDYWVARRRLPAGTRLTATMLRRRSGDLGRLPESAIRDLDLALGQVTTRTLAPGAVIQRSQLQAPELVHRRQPVTVAASGPGFRVTRQGQALQDGGLGDTVRVRLADRSTVTGVVTGPGLVAVQ